MKIKFVNKDHNGGLMIMTAYLNRLLIFLTLLMPIATISAQEIKPEAKDPIDELIAEESAKRQKIYEKAEALVSEGKTLAFHGKNEEANALFNEAEATLKTIAGDFVELKEKQLNAYIASFRIKWAKNIKNAAYKYFSDKDYDAAIMKVTQAQQIKGLPDAIKSELQNFIKVCQGKIESIEFAEKTDLNYKDVDPDNKIRKYEMDVAFSKAKTLLRNKQYTRARDAFERILVRDPYNFKATEELRRLYKKLRGIGIDRRKNDRLERASEVQWKWAEAVLPLPAKRPVANETVEAKSSKSVLANKLITIIIKNINFTDVNIQTVVRYLAEESKRLDTLGAGINIALGINEEELANVPTVTMNLENIPLGEVIRYLCQTCGLKYRVDDQVLTIGTDAIDPMDTRFFKVRAALVTRIAPTDAAAGADGEDEGFGEDDMFDTTTTFEDDGAGGASTRRAVTTEALKAYFEERGVPFPEGSTIAYDRRAGKLIVKNTHENLRRLDTLLRALDLEQPQVLIEAKFIETGQNDLEELGFEWWFNTTPTNPNALRFNTNDTLVRPLGTNVDGVSSPIDPTTFGRLINNLAFPAFGPGDDYNLSMMLHAMDRHDNFEILSAPKVISKSGEEATIRMVREEYYPDSWTEPELAVINTFFSYTPAYPEFGEATDVGIRFIVTPTVSPNNYTITLALNPQVLALAGWSSYNIAYAYPTAGGQVSGSTVVKMPNISRRDVNTNVRVYDGDTIVLGGMLTENASGNDDRFPVAGSVPLLGFLASVQTSRNNKTNLLIFVTARIVNPDGLPVRISPNNGLFDFRR
jgi:general secretion pathway protein D